MSDDLLNRIRNSIEGQRAHLGEIDEMMAELRAAGRSRRSTYCNL